MATIDLGKIKLVNRGAYNNSTAYTVDDLVQSGGTTYICIQNSTGNAVTNTSYWNVLAQKGTDGTDVGAILANKEIAFKTNAGAVDGIPIGNAGEFLKVNSGATGYEYGSVSSDFVFLGSGTASSASSVSVDFFSADYDLYKIFVTGWYGSAAGHSTRMRLNSSAGTAASNAVYRHIFTGGYYSNIGNANGTQNTGNWDAAYFNLSNISSNAQEFGDHEITVFRPYSSSTKTSVIVTGGGHEQNHIYSRHGHGIFNTAMQHTGITLYASSGTVTIPYIKVFGLKTS